MSNNFYVAVTDELEDALMSIDEAVTVLEDGHLGIVDEVNWVARLAVAFDIMLDVHQEINAEGKNDTV